MLFHSSIRRELTRSFGASWVVLFTITMTVRLVRTLHDANIGRADPQEIAAALGYAALGQMPAILSIALFIATVATLSRMYRDSEMVIWFGGGRGLLGFVSPLYRFAWPILILVAVLQWWAWPWTNQQLQDLRQRFEQRADLERVAPGQFQESASGNKVFFIEKNQAGDDTGRSVFMLDMSQGNHVITTAKSGITTRENGQTVLTLTDGQRLQRDPLTQVTRILDFAELSTVLAQKTYSGGSAGYRGADTLSLWRQGDRFAQGELAWRAGMVLLAANLLLMALAVAQVNPRMGSGGSIAIAALVAIVYFNLSTVSQNWITTGKASLMGAMTGLHGSVALLTLLWLFKRHQQWQWRLRRSRKPRGPGNRQREAGRAS